MHNRIQTPVESTGALSATYAAHTLAVTGSWRTLALLDAIGVLALAAFFSPTLISIVSIWSRSETFAHGSLIFPISLFLIWRNRKELARCAPNTDSRALPALFVLGLAWMLAHSADVLVIEQLAFVAMIPSLSWLLLGAATVKKMLFPLGFRYWVGGSHTANAYKAKLLESVARVFGGSRKGAGIVVFTSLTEDPEVARSVLQRFVADMLPSIDSTLESASV